MAISIDQLAAAVNKELELYAGRTDEEVAAAVDEVAKTTVRELKQTSPHRTGAYARAWRQTTPTRGPHSYQRIVNAGKLYRLTHLLENGHRVAQPTSGKTWVGPSPSQGHIKPAEQHAIEQFEAALRRNIEAIR